MERGAASAGPVSQPGQSEARREPLAGTKTAHRPGPSPNRRGGRFPERLLHYPWPGGSIPAGASEAPATPRFTRDGTTGSITPAGNPARAHEALVAASLG